MREWRRARSSVPSNLREMWNSSWSTVATRWLLCAASMRRLVPFAMALFACGGNKTPDAGPMIDSSCGIDCAAQARYGLLAGQCYEYSDGTTTVSPPPLAAEVRPKVEL